MTTATTPAGPRCAPPTRDPVVWVWAAAAFVSFLGDTVWVVGLSWAAVNAAPPAVAGLVVAVGMARNPPPTTRTQASPWLSL